MQDKIALLMRETGCERGEAELALEMCGFDVEKAVGAIRRLFREVLVLKGRARVGGDSLYVLFQAILNLDPRSLLRVRAVASFNPAVFSARMDQHWFEFEKHLFASRLRAGALAPLSQELEGVLQSYLSSPEAAAFYAKGRAADGRRRQALAVLLTAHFDPLAVRLDLRGDVLDMGQFQEIEPAPAAPAAGPEGFEARRWPRPPASLVLRVALEGSPDGVLAQDLAPGDLVYAQITDARDIARYLSRVFGARTPGSSFLRAPIESAEPGSGNEIRLRVRFSIGACGEVSLPGNVRLKAARRG